MRRIRPPATRTPRASYTDWSEMAPISALTASATASAAMWGWPATARKTANRWAVTWIPRCRRRSAGAVGTLVSVDQLFDWLKDLTSRELYFAGFWLTAELRMERYIVIMLAGHVHIGVPGDCACCGGRSGGPGVLSFRSPSGGVERGVGRGRPGGIAR